MSCIYEWNVTLMWNSIESMCVNLQGRYQDRSVQILMGNLAFHSRPEQGITSLKSSFSQISLINDWTQDISSNIDLF